MALQLPRLDLFLDPLELLLVDLLLVGRGLDVLLHWEERVVLHGHPPLPPFTGDRRHIAGEVTDARR